MSRLTDELRRRQDELAWQGFTGIAEQRAGTDPARRLPHLVVLVDGWEGWLPTLGEHDFGGLTDAVFALMREGAGVGIHLVVTGDRQLLVGRISSLTEDKYALRLVDRADYGMIGVRQSDVPEEMPAGRALRADQGTEVQVALPAEDATGRREEGPARAAAVTPGLLVGRARRGAAPQERGGISGAARQGAPASGGRQAAVRGGPLGLRPPLRWHAGCRCS